MRSTTIRARSAQCGLTFLFAEVVETAAKRPILARVGVDEPALQSGPRSKRPTEGFMPSVARSAIAEGSPRRRGKVDWSAINARLRRSTLLKLKRHKEGRIGRRAFLNTLESNAECRTIGKNGQAEPVFNPPSRRLGLPRRGERSIIERRRIGRPDHARQTNVDVLIKAKKRGDRRQWASVTADRGWPISAFMCFPAALIPIGSHLGGIGGWFANLGRPMFA